MRNFHFSVPIEKLNNSKFLNIIHILLSIPFNDDEKLQQDFSSLIEIILKRNDENYLDSHPKKSLLGHYEIIYALIQYKKSFLTSKILGYLPIVAIFVYNFSIENPPVHAIVRSEHETLKEICKVWSNPSLFIKEKIQQNQYKYKYGAIISNVLLFYSCLFGDFISISIIMDHFSDFLMPNIIVDDFVSDAEIKDCGSLVDFKLVPKTCFSALSNNNINNNDETKIMSNSTISQLLKDFIVLSKIKIIYFLENDLNICSQLANIILDFYNECENCRLT